MTTKATAAAAASGASRGTTTTTALRTASTNREPAIAKRTSSVQKQQQPPQTQPQQPPQQHQQQHQQQQVPVKLSNARFDANRCADPFATSNKKCKTTFAQSYIQGNIPCRLQSSAAKYSLQWDQYAADGFSPDLLVVCADGLCETVHPHVLMAPMMFEELLARTQGASDMLAPVFVTVVGHLRKALLDAAATAAGVKGTLQLVQAANNGNLLLPQLPKLIPALAQALRAPAAKKFQDQIMMIFGLLEQHCGPEATKMIKAKIPTYS